MPSSGYSVLHGINPNKKNRTQNSGDFLTSNPWLPKGSHSSFINNPLLRISDSFPPFKKEMKSFNRDIIIGAELSNMADKHYNTHTFLKMLSKTNHSLQITCTLMLLIKLLMISQQIL